MPDVLNPFSTEQLDDIEKAVESAKLNDEAIKKALRAGIDLPGMLDQNRELSERLRKILNTYRPR